jgi:3-oxoadipate enol-lactonase
MKVMTRTTVDGLDLEYELRGAGDPVVLIHWGVSAAWAEPLLEQPALSRRHLLLSYHRAGFGGSSPVEGAVDIGDHARHCRLLMGDLGIERAHVVGHSSSALIALQLALDSPEAVSTLVLMEPARPIPKTELQAAFLREVVEPSLARYRAGDKAGAVDTWARGVFGLDYRDAMPGLAEQCVADADAFFSQELPALQRWSFTEDEARRITQPVLAVVGENTAPSFPERVELLCSWLPDAELFELPAASHLLHLQNPEAMAEALSSFYVRHPT